LSTTVSMPQLGETVTEGTILRWAKQVGDTIAEDEVLVEISTDKVDTEVPSPVAGTILDILVPEGETVEVGVDLVVIGQEGESAGAAPGGEETETALAPEVAADLHPASETPAGADTGFEAGQAAKLSDEEVEAFFAEPSPAERPPRLLSPVVRRLIREHDVDVANITGTGQGGRVTRRDVEAYISGNGVSTAPEPVTTPAPAASPEPAEAPPVEPEPAAPSPVGPAAKPAEPAAPVEAPSAEPTRAPVADSASEVVELSRMRVRVAENNIKARRTAAHVWTAVEVDFERVERVRQAHKARFKDDEGFSLTYLPFISRATIDALKAFPVVNSSLDLEKKTATFHKKVDLGIAIDLNQEGLVVARVRNADGLRLVGIAREIAALAERGRAGDLGIDDLTGSTFTITNPGPFGSFMSAPIINVPNVAILSTDTVTKRPTVVTTPDGQDMIAIRHIGYLGLSWDHRAFDGSTAVLFLRRIKDNLETWDWEQELA
jgi:pyruvate dehydrogenase E2 component (dihydrolipoamide acetyltransferase)